MLSPLAGFRSRFLQVLRQHWPIYAIIVLTALLTQFPLLTDYRRLLLTAPDGAIHPDTINYLSTQQRVGFQLPGATNPLRDPTQNAPEG